MATIKDVARKARVSIATVSRAFNCSGPVKDETRRRIRAAAAVLRYAPHGAARSLTTRKTNTVGVLLPDLYGEFFSEIIRGVDEAAQRLGYHLLVSSAHDSQEAIEAAMHAMRGRVDGLIVMCPDLDAATLASKLPKGLPLVLVDSAVEQRTGRPRFNSLSIDNYGGAYSMVTHLVRMGHERIAIIRGPARNHDAKERLRGYRAAMRRALLDAPPEWQLAGDFSEAAGYRAALELLGLSPIPTALFASNDSMALGALSALRDVGIEVPRELAVAGFDDIPLARYASPALTSVHVPISELGRRATDVLVAAIRGRARRVRRQETLPTTLVVRQSCGGGQHSRGQLQGVALKTASLEIEPALTSGG